MKINDFVYDTKSLKIQFVLYYVYGHNIRTSAYLLETREKRPEYEI